MLTAQTEAGLTSGDPPFGPITRRIGAAAEQCLLVWLNDVALQVIVRKFT